MKKLLLIFIVIILAAVGLVTLLNQKEKPTENISISKFGEKENNMKIQSPVFGGYTLIPPKYTCDGQNISPPLTVSGVPEGSKSLVLIVDDPDAPSGTWIHWTVFNIDPKTNLIAENSVPSGVEGKTSFGKTGYGGPCPSSGQHRYFFKLYALDTVLDLDSSADKSAIEKAMQGHINASTELVAFYAKAK